MAPLIHNLKQFSMSTFINEYIESAKKLYKKYKNKDMDLETEIKLLDKLQEKLLDPNFNIDIIIHNNYKHTVDELKLIDLVNKAYDDEFIISGYGTLFEKHKNNLSPLIQFLITMQNNRKTEKGLALNHINDADKRIYMIHQIRQLLFKLIGNAEYGASGEKNFIFGNEMIGPSTTYCGYAIITSGIMFLEGLMENNLSFESMDAVLRFIEEVELYTERFPDSISPWLDDPNEITPEVLLNYFIEKKCSDSENINVSALRTICSNMDQEFRNRVYYTNNFYEFLKQYKIQEILAQCYSYNFTNPNKPPEEIAEPMAELVSLIRKFVSHPFIRYNRVAIVKTLKRKNILLVDSDSLFTYLGSFIKRFETYFDGLDINHPMHKIASAHIANNIIGCLIQDVLDAVTSGLNVSTEYQSRINMKSEFLFKRVAMTRNKKNYSNIKLVVEGNVLNPPQDEIKGLPIKKVSTNAKTRDYFYNMLLDEILMPENIDPKAILRKFIKFEELVFDSITNRRSTEFLTPGKYTNIDVYADPTKNAVVKAVKLWNAMSPDNLIQPYSKVYILKIKPVIDDNDLAVIQEEFPDVFESLSKCIKTEVDYFGKSGAKAIAIPKTLKEIPKSLIKLIDVDTIVTDNTKAAYPIMESLGFQMIPITGSNKQISTFIDL